MREVGIQTQVPQDPNPTLSTVPHWLCVCLRVNTELWISTTEHSQKPPLGRKEGNNFVTQYIKRHTSPSGISGVRLSYNDWKSKPYMEVHGTKDHMQEFGIKQILILHFLFSKSRILLRIFNSTCLMYLGSRCVYVCLCVRERNWLLSSKCFGFNFVGIKIYYQNTLLVADTKQYFQPLKIAFPFLFRKVVGKVPSNFPLPLLSGEVHILSRA